MTRGTDVKARRVRPGVLCACGKRRVFNEGELCGRCQELVAKAKERRGTETWNHERQGWRRLGEGAWMR